MILLIISGFLLAILVPLLFKIFGEKASKIMGFLPLILFIQLLTYYNEIGNGAVIHQKFNWVKSLGITFDVYLDGLGFLFAAIITLIGAAVFFYSAEYLKGNPKIVHFFVYINIFMASMLGVVLSNNIIALFIFWELTSISSYFLIGFNHEEENSRNSALQALLVTGGGGLAMFAGLIILSIITGTTAINEINDLNSLITSNSLYFPILILILLGAFTKSAQFPFHFWLPNAMAAPSPVSAYLHSATMVKAGVYLLARFHPALSNTLDWEILVSLFGAVTMFIGVVMAMKQTDLKKLLAYTTVSVLGTLTMLIGVGTKTAIKAMLIYLLAHSLYKGALFLLAGIVDHETGSRDIRQLRGLKKYMPFTFSVGIISALSMSGIIPFIGFIGKEYLYDSLLENYLFGPGLLIITIVSSVLMMVIALSVGYKIFMGEEKYPAQKPHEAPFLMIAGPVVLVFFTLIFGLIPDITFTSAISGAFASIIGHFSQMHISLWHGFSLVLALSVLTIALGLVTYYFRDSIFEKIKDFRGIEKLKPTYWYDKSFNGLLNIAKFQTRFIQNGFLRSYISIIVFSTLILAGYALVKYNNIYDIKLSLDINIYEILVFITMMIAVTLIFRSKSRLTAVAALGVIGLGMTMIFILYGAPDLAMTQFAVETLTVIIFVLVIYKLPRFVTFSSLSERIKDFMLALSFGIFMSLTVLFITSGELPAEMKQYFIENSYTIAKGRNIVNVILVDFRAMDTMGEIIVLGVAAIGVFSLLKLKMYEEEQ
jgi:multicomponent Na+:H+ antiporter subunit A